MGRSKEVGRIGILGAGQLGRMLWEARSSTDRLVFLDPSPRSPVAAAGGEVVGGDFREREAVLAFGRTVDVLSIEIEDVNVDALQVLADEGVRVVPSSSTIEIVQDKGVQKGFFAENGIPSAKHWLCESRSAVQALLDQGSCSLPLVQKRRRGGYDGRGVQRIENAGELASLWDGPTLVEEAVSIGREISVVVARDQSGRTVSYDPTEMLVDSRLHQLELLIAPARIDEEVRASARRLAEETAGAFGLVGLLAVELFVLKNGELLVNEVAPRPHNSGHHTIEATRCSQFQQLLRILREESLGPTDLVSPAAMMNLVGAPGGEGPAHFSGLESVASRKDVFLHDYGKETTRPGRKMGHLTCLGETVEAAVGLVREIGAMIKVVPQAAP